MYIFYENDLSPYYVFRRATLQQKFHLKNFVEIFGYLR